MFDGTAWTTTASLLTSVLWEPYGGLRGYQITLPASVTAANVEYLLGDKGTVPPSGNTCPASPPSVSTSDHTGLVRSLFVSTGTLAPGQGVGDLFKQTYTWKADQVTQVNSCLLGAPVAHIEGYGYDGQVRLRNASGTNNGSVGGAFSSRSYSYDARGNRMYESREDCVYPLSYDPTHPDWMTLQKSSCSGDRLAYTYTYDADGRVRSRSAPVDSGGTAAFVVTFNPEDSGPTPQVGWRARCVPCR